MPTTARAPRNRRVLKNLAIGFREYFYPRSAKQRAYVVPFNNTRKNKNNNNKNNNNKNKRKNSNNNK
jgi:hypothetical protein